MAKRQARVSGRADPVDGQGLFIGDTHELWENEHPLAFTMLERQAARRMLDLIETEYGDDYPGLSRELWNDENDLLDALFDLDYAFDRTQSVLANKQPAPVQRQLPQQPAQLRAVTPKPPDPTRPSPAPYVHRPPPKPVEPPAHFKPHVLEKVKPAPAPPGWEIIVPKALATRLLGWYWGRPSCEWSALATVKVVIPGERSRKVQAALAAEAHDPIHPKVPRKFIFEDAFFCDQGQDSGALSVIPADWEMKLVDKLLAADRDADVAKLLGHIHSHNSMSVSMTGAGFSGQDDRMVGTRLDEQSAMQNRQGGYCVSLVLGRDGDSVGIHGRYDVWHRLPGPEENAHELWRWFNTYDPIPVRVAWPDTMSVADWRTSYRSDTPTTYRWSPSASAYLAAYDAYAGGMYAE